MKLDEVNRKILHLEDAMLEAFNRLQSTLQRRDEVDEEEEEDYWWGE